jgi:hypothetical protein
MKSKFFHGSCDYHEKYIPAGKYVTLSKPYACCYAERKNKGNGYIYVLLLNPETELKEENMGKTVDHVLINNASFIKRISVTEKVKAECRAKTKVITASLEG